MSNAQIATRIKQICKEKNVTISQLLEECKIRKSLIYDLEKRDYTPSVTIINVIADYLNVSVDYLLGRTDKPNAINADIKTGNIGDNCNNNNNSINISGQKKLDEMSEELLKRFNELSFDEKLNVFNFIKNKGSLK